MKTLLFLRGLASTHCDRTSERDSFAGVTWWHGPRPQQSQHSRPAPAASRETPRSPPTSELSPPASLRGGGWCWRPQGCTSQEKTPPPTLVVSTWVSAYLLYLLLIFSRTKIRNGIERGEADQLPRSPPAEGGVERAGGSGGGLREREGRAHRTPAGQSALHRALRWGQAGLLDTECPLRDSWPRTRGHAPWGGLRTWGSCSLTATRLSRHSCRAGRTSRDPEGHEA